VECRELQWQLVTRTYHGRAAEEDFATTHVYAVGKEVAPLTPGILKLQKMKLRLNEIDLNRQCTLKKMVTDQHPTGLVRVWCPPTDTKFVRVQVANEFFMEGDRIWDQDTESNGKSTLAILITWGIWVC